jgi:hypothetical protein
VDIFSERTMKARNGLLVTSAAGILLWGTHVTVTLPNKIDLAKQIDLPVILSNLPYWSIHLAVLGFLLAYSSRFYIGMFGESQIYLSKRRRLIEVVSAELTRMQTSTRQHAEEGKKAGDLLLTHLNMVDEASNEIKKLEAECETLVAPLEKQRREALTIHHSVGDYQKLDEQIKLVTAQYDAKMEPYWELIKESNKSKGVKEAINKDWLKPLPEEKQLREVKAFLRNLAWRGWFSALFDAAIPTVLFISAIYFLMAKFWYAVGHLFLPPADSTWVDIAIVVVALFGAVVFAAYQHSLEADSG